MNRHQVGLHDELANFLNSHNPKLSAGEVEEVLDELRSHVTKV